MRRSWTRLGLASLALVALAAGGCSSGKSLKEQNALLMEENQTLRSQLDDRNTALDRMNQELRDRDIQLSESRRQMSDMESRALPASTGATGFEGIPGVTGSMAPGEVTATVESDILFDSGKATLRPAAKQALNAVADVLNGSYAGKAIRIGGHTDTDPIKKSGHTSNYHLGFERAYAVRDYLVSRGVSANRVYLASYGPDRPLGSKPQSRRVEIVVVMQ
jgi:outer membrane protein OmpA-like peptidoglycan-associated protein